MSERIKRSMASVFGVPIASIPDDATINVFPEWDSLRHLELMLALEKEFGVHISTNAMLELLSMRAIEEYLNQRQMAKPE